jgi:hypothetical protein
MIYILALFITKIPLPNAPGVSYEFDVEVIVVCTKDRGDGIPEPYYGDVRKDVDRCTKVEEVRMFCAVHRTPWDWSNGRGQSDNRCTRKTRLL